MPTMSDLRQRQALPLIAKVHMSQARIREWYQHFNGDVCVSFSGGKDSTVLAHLVHDLYPDVPMLFVNTGLEYPEIQAFARKMGATFVRPKMTFHEVISTYGYPIISKENADAIYYSRKIRNGTKGIKIKNGTIKPMVVSKREELNGERTKIKVTEQNNQWEGWRRKTMLGNGDFGGKSLFNKTKWLPLCRETQFMIGSDCCHVMKKSPLRSYQNRNHIYPYLGTLAEESRLRTQSWLLNGCNAFDASKGKKTSQPLSFWTEQDVLRYILENDIEIASVYGDIVAVDKDGFEYKPLPGAECNLRCSGCDRTGCIFCGFGCHLEKGETRFQRLAKTHPRQYEYCMGGGQWVDNPNYDPAAPKMDGDWENWNPKKIWVPSKKGLGMKKVFDDCNAIYGKDFIRYE